MNLVGQCTVLGAGGEHLGTLMGVGINAETNRVMDLTVRPRAQGPALIFPVQAVVVAEADQIRLGRQGELAEVEVGGTVGTAGGTLARRELSFFATVTCLDGVVGTLSRILCDEYTYDVETLIVGPGESLQHEVGVPMEWVREMHRNRIVISCTRNELADAPPAPLDR